MLYPLTAILVAGLAVAHPAKNNNNNKKHEIALTARATTISWSSLGCYNEPSSGRALGSYEKDDGNLTVEQCQSYCAAGSYKYAGMEYGYQCWCSNTLNSAATTTSASNCGYPCPGNSKEFCGGYYTLSVYQATYSVTPDTSTSAVSPGGYSYSGGTCYADGNPRALVGTSTDQGIMTPAVCADYCGSRSYSYFGVEYATQCFCGNTIGSATIDNSNCNYPCRGDSTKMCGGYYAINVYSVTKATASSTTSTSTTSSPTPTATGWNSIGCFNDSPRQLQGGNGGTPQTCQAYCLSKGFTIAGNEYGGECYCGNSISMAAKFADNSNCNMACNADKTQTCGGYYALQAYQYVAPTTSTTSTTSTTTSPTASPTLTADSKGYVGCYADTGSRLNGVAMSYPGALTPPACQKACAAANYTFAGVEYSSQCFCGNAPLTNTKIAESNCNYPCNGDSTAYCGGYYAIGVLYATIPSLATSTTSTTTSTTSTTTTTTTTTSSTTAYGAVSTNAAFALQTGATKPASAGTRALYAHHMIGNTYSYTVATWTDDINLAKGAGIDGFALNMGADSYEPGQIANAFSAANSVGGFKLFFSFDVTSFGCGGTADAQNLANLVLKYAKGSSYATYNGMAIVSTFSGEFCQFGQGSVQSGWAFVKQLIKNGGVNPIVVPSIFANPDSFKSSNGWIDGELNWNSGWPMGGSNLDTSSDRQYINALGSKPYMAGISPCFFTYYGPSTWNKNWIYRSDNWLMATRFESLIGMRNQIPFAEIISWNDYGESHYIGPIRQDQPNSQGWTNGMPHTAWLSLIAYYAPAWKYGTYPANSDALWLWSRPHPKMANPTSPTLSRPSGAGYTDDNLYVFAVLAADSTVTITSGSNTAKFFLPAGPNKISIASAPGSIGASIVRNGQTIKTYTSGSDFQYTNTPPDFNFNYFVAGV